MTAVGRPVRDRLLICVTLMHVVLASMLAEARAASERFAGEEGCTVEWSKIWSIEPISFDRRLIEFCAESVQETAGVSHGLPSGPLHDAAEVARTGIPTVMMFTRSLGGLSHNKAEDTRIDDLKMAVQAFDRLARRTVNWLSGKGDRRLASVFKKTFRSSESAMFAAIVHNSHFQAREIEEHPKEDHCRLRDAAYLNVTR